MTVTDTAEAAHRVASTAMYGGATVSASSGASMFFGYSQGEWQVIGIVGGLLIGLLGLVANAGINFYFKAQHLRIARERLEASNEAGD